MSETTQQETAKQRRSIGFRIFKWLMILGGLSIALIILIAMIAISSGDKEGSKQTESQQIVTPFNIGVTSQIVKKVDGKYRYFFDIRNNDSKPFEGSVTITLISAEGRELGDETFKTNKSIDPTLGTSQYFDINTAPTAVHGEVGIKSFRYEVYQADSLVNKGEAEISSKLE